MFKKSVLLGAIFFCLTNSIAVAHPHYNMGNITIIMAALAAVHQAAELQNK